MELQFNSLDDINEYYKSLNIQPYWLEESLGFNIVKEITLIFNNLHDLYPYVVIKEIGDCYSYDKINNKICIDESNKRLHDSSFYNIFETEEKKVMAKKSLEKILKDASNKKITKKYDEYGNLYCEYEYSAKYWSKERRILFNHAAIGDHKENTVHEFAHAIAYQYDLNKNKNIQKIYGNLKSYEVLLNVSLYANKNIYEFIAEVFTQSYYFKQNNSIIEQVMNVLYEKVRTNKAKSNIDIEIDKIIKRQQGH